MWMLALGFVLMFASGWLARQAKQERAEAEVRTVGHRKVS